MTYGGRSYKITAGLFEKASREGWAIKDSDGIFWVGRKGDSLECDCGNAACRHLDAIEELRRRINEQRNPDATANPSTALRPTQELREEVIEAHGAEV